MGWPPIDAAFTSCAFDVIHCMKANAASFLAEFCGMAMPKPPSSPEYFTAFGCSA